MGALRRALCLIGIHDWRPTAWLTCNPLDAGRVCRRCYKDRP